MFKKIEVECDTEEDYNNLINYMKKVNKQLCQCGHTKEFHHEHIENKITCCYIGNKANDIQCSCNKFIKANNG